MKKINLLLTAVVFAAVAVIMSSCGQTEVEYDKALLTGKWQDKAKTTLYYVYNSDGSGYTWDEADDITEDEAQKFTWTLEGDDLTQIHIMEMGATVPKTYVVTNLTDTELAYKDELGGKTYTFTKVK